MLEEDSPRSPTRQARKARLGIEGYSRFGNADFKKVGRRQIAAGRRQKTEDRGQKAEVRKQNKLIS
jgi:hypothetical protein